MLNHLDTVIGFVVVILGVSMLITILTQIVAATLGLRGTNLKWGIRTLLETLSPELKDHAEIISQKVLQHPLISDSTITRLRNNLPFISKRWMLSSAITSGELLKILKLLADSAPAEGQDAETEAGKNALAALSQALKKIDPQAQTIEDATKSILDVTKTLKAHLPSDLVLGDHLKKIDELAEKARSVAGKVVATTTQEMADLEHWFDAMMGRVSQRFTFQTRLWTVFFAFILAFSIHLDSVDLFKRLATDAELRGQLAASADTMRNHAEIMLTAASPNQNPSQEELKARLTGLKDQAVAIKAELEGNKFQLIPSPYPDWDSYCDLKHLFGVLASVALLSLGAPFWFNVLKTLGNLKPVIAKKIEDQQDQK